MPRRPRATRDARVHHVYSRGVGRGNIFIEVSDYEAFARFLGDAMEVTGVELHMFVLQPNHFHLEPVGTVAVVSKTMQLALAPHAQRFNVLYDRRGHLFQGRFGSKPIHDDVYYLIVLRYGILNAVFDGHCTVEELIDYPYTSFPAMMGKPSLIAVNLDAVLRFFGSNEAEARARFEAFIRDGLEIEDRDPVRQAIGTIARASAARAGLTWDDLRGGRLDREQARVRQAIVNEVRFRMPTASDRIIASVLGISQATLRRIPRLAGEQTTGRTGELLLPAGRREHGGVAQGDEGHGEAQRFQDGEPVDEGAPEDAIAERDVEDVGDEGAAA